MTIDNMLQKYTKIRNILCDNKLKAVDSDNYMIDIFTTDENNLIKALNDSDDTIIISNDNNHNDIVVDRITFIKQFNLATNWLFYDYNWDNTLVVNILPLVSSLNHNLPKTISLKQYLEALIGPISIEICIYGLTTNNFKNKINEIVNHIEQITSSEIIMRYTEDSVIIVISEPFQMVTIHSIKYKSKVQCLYSMDNIGLIYDGINIWSTIKSYSELHAKTFIYNKNHHNTNEYNAYIRYLFELNFDIHISQISHISPYSLFTRELISPLLQTIAYFNGYMTTDINHGYITDITTKKFRDEINIKSANISSIANDHNDTFNALNINDDARDECDIFDRSKFVTSLLFSHDNLQEVLDIDKSPYFKYGNNNIEVCELLCAYAPHGFIIGWIDKWKGNITNDELTYMINLLIVFGNNMTAIALFDNYIKDNKDNSQINNEDNMTYKLFNSRNSLLENAILSNNLQMIHYIKIGDHMHYSNINDIIRKTLPYISYEAFCMFSDSIDYGHKIDDCTLLNDIINELITNKTNDLVLMFTKLLNKCNVIYNGDISSEPLYQIIMSCDHELFGIFMNHVKDIDDKFLDELIMNLKSMYDHYKMNNSREMLSFIKIIYYYIVNIKPISDDLFDEYSKTYNKMVSTDIFDKAKITTNNTNENITKNIYKYVGKLSGINIINSNYIDHLEKSIMNRDYESLGLLLGSGTTLCIEKNNMTPYHWATKLDDYIIFRKLLDIGVDIDGNDGLNDIFDNLTHGNLLTFMFKYKSYRCIQVLISYEHLANFVRENITTEMILSVTDIDLLFAILIEMDNPSIKISVLSDLKHMTNELFCFIYEYSHQIKYLESEYDSLDSHGNNILHLLANITNLTKSVSYILNNANDVINNMLVHKNLKGQIPLMVAFEVNNKDIARLYLRQCDDIIVNDNNGDTIAHYLASIDDCLPLLNNITQNSKLFTIQNNHHHDPIMMAIMCNNTNFINTLIKCDIFNVNNSDFYGNTYLHYICAGNINKNICINLDVKENMENFLGIAPIDHIVTKILNLIRDDDVVHNYHGAKEINTLSRIYRFLINIKRETDYEKNYNILRGMIFSNNNNK
jgi:hypothetical protein